MELRPGATGYGYIQIILGKKDVERLDGEYPICSQRRMPARGETVHIFRSLRKIAEPTVSCGGSHIDIILPHNYRAEDVVKILNKRKYELKNSRGASNGRVLEILIEPENENIPG